MREQLENDLVLAITPYVDKSHMSEVKFAITIAVSQYDISKSETALTVYEGDINENIMKRFLAAKIAQGCSKRTITYYKSSVGFVLETIGKPYMDITADDIRLYLAQRIHSDGVSKATANNERRNLSSFYGWLQKEEILLKNPMNKIDTIKETKAKKKAYSLMDLEKIRMACRTKRESALVEFLISTWCRVSEVLEVKISDINGDKLTVHGKGDKYREVYLNAKAILAVDQYLKERHDNNPYLFAGSRCSASSSEFHEACIRNKTSFSLWYTVPELVNSGDNIPDPSIVENTIRNIGKRAGVENVHPHRFRRTGATMALRAGMPITTVSKLLGHESIETTQIYLDISDEELEQAHRKYVV